MASSSARRAWLRRWLSVRACGTFSLWMARTCAIWSGDRLSCFSRAAGSLGLACVAAPSCVCAGGGAAFVCARAGATGKRSAKANPHEAATRELRASVFMAENLKLKLPGRSYDLFPNGSGGQLRRSLRLSLLRGIDRAEQVCEPRHASLLSRGEVVLVIFDYGELRAAPRRPPRALLTSLQRGVARGELLLLQLGLKEADALRVLILKPRALVRHATVNALPDGGVELLLRVAALNRHLNLLFHDVLLNAGSEGEAVRVPADFRARERQSGQPADDEQRGHAARLKPQRREREELAQRSQRRTLPLRRGMRTRGERQLLANVEQGDCAQHLRAPLADHLAHRAERGQLFAADGAAVEVDAKRLRLFGRGLAVEVRDQLLGTPAAARVRAVVQARGVRLLSHCGATSN